MVPAPVNDDVGKFPLSVTVGETLVVWITVVPW